MKKTSLKQRAMNLLISILSVFILFRERFIFGEDIDKQYGGDYTPPGGDGSGESRTPDARMVGGKEQIANNKGQITNKDEKPDKADPSAVSAGKDGAEDSKKLMDLGYNEADIKAMDDVKRKEVLEKGVKKESAKADFDQKAVSTEKDGEKGDEEEEVFKIGDKEVSKEDFVKVEEALKKSFKNYADMSEEDKMEWRLKELNIVLASKSYEKKFQDLAKEKRNIKEEKESISDERDELNTQSANIQDEYIKLLALKEKNDDLLKQKPGKVDEIADMKLISRQTTAETQNAAIENRIKELSNLANNIKVEAEEKDVIMLTMELQNEYPELLTTQPVHMILHAHRLFKEGKASKDVDPEDLVRANLVKRVIRDYDGEIDPEDRKHSPIGTWFKEEVENYPAYKKISTAQTGKGKRKTLTEVKAENAKDIVSRIMKRQADNPPPPGASGSTVSGHKKEKSEETVLKEQGYKQFTPAKGYE